MFYEDDDEDDGLTEEKAKALKRELIERSKKEFVAGCYEAYDILATQGKGALDGTEIKAIQKAINRMMSLFIMKEEYERCQFLKNYVKNYIPGFEIQPDKSVGNELSL
jgi:hypothetical protein